MSEQANADRAAQEFLESINATTRRVVHLSEALGLAKAALESVWHSAAEEAEEGGLVFWCRFCGQPQMLGQIPVHRPECLVSKAFEAIARLEEQEPGKVDLSPVPWER